jgi:uncharacterized membrane protein YeaQ/YmgE (transglycosylase-associated protein family)
MPEQGRPQSLKESPVDIIGVIIAGIIIGLLGKFFAPGDRDNIPLWLTVVCGVGGVLIGYYLAAALGVEATSGIDWIRWIISIVVLWTWAAAKAWSSGVPRACRVWHARGQAGSGVLDGVSLPLVSYGMITRHDNTGRRARAR